jgi:hypothetical protein
MQAQERKQKEKQVRDFFIQHCKNPEINNLQEFAYEGDFMSLLGIPFFPEEMIDEDTKRPMDCLVHVVCRVHDFRVLRILVELVGSEIMFSDRNKLGMNALQFFLACRPSRTLTSEEEEWIFHNVLKFQEMPDNNDVKSELYECHGGHHYGALVTHMNDFTNGEDERSRIYSSFMHLMECAKHHGFLFRPSHVHQFVEGWAPKQFGIHILDKALAMLPRERWTERNGLLGALIRIGVNTAKRYRSLLLDRLIEKCIFHFNAEEWIMYCDDDGPNTAFSYFIHAQYYDVLAAGQVRRKGFEKHVLVWAVERFPLHIWDAKSWYFILLDNHTLFDILIPLFESFMQRLLQKSQESPNIISAFVQARINMTVNGKRQNWFFDCLNLVDTFDTTPQKRWINRLVSVVVLILLDHPALFSLAQAQLKTSLWSLVIGSLRGEELAVENVFQTLDTLFPDEHENFNKKAEWYNPLCVLHQMVGRQTHVLVCNDDEERKKQQVPTL